MHRIGHDALRGLLCMLLALLALTGGLGVRASVADGGASAALSTEDAAVSQIAATRFDARLPFLAGSSTLLATPVELSTRLLEPLRGRAVGAPGYHSPADAHEAVLAALRVRAANDEHAAVARSLADARAGRAEARSTPPPSSVS